jgi:uncharacterized membrane protein
MILPGIPGKSEATNVTSLAAYSTKNMLTRHHGLKQQAPTLVKVDPNLARLRLLRILIVVIMLLWIASLMTDYSAFGSITGRHVLPDVFLLDLSSLIVAFALFIFVGLFLTRFWKRLERRRQAFTLSGEAGAGIIEQIDGLVDIDGRSILLMSLSSFTFPSTILLLWGRVTLSLRGQICRSLAWSVWLLRVLSRLLWMWKQKVAQLYRNVKV